jgi:hypothetical protein
MASDLLIPRADLSARDTVAGPHRRPRNPFRARNNRRPVTEAELGRELLDRHQLNSVDPEAGELRDLACDIEKRPCFPRQILREKHADVQLVDHEIRGTAGGISVSSQRKIGAHETRNRPGTGSLISAQRDRVLDPSCRRRRRIFFRERRPQNFSTASRTSA